MTRKGHPGPPRLGTVPFGETEAWEERFERRDREDSITDSNLRTAVGLRSRKFRGRTRRWSLAQGGREGPALATELY